MRNKAAAAALGGEEAEQINSGAAESPMSAAIKAFKSDVTLGGGGMGVAEGRWEGGGGRRRAEEKYSSQLQDLVLERLSSLDNHSDNKKKTGAGPLAVSRQAA